MTGGLIDDGAKGFRAGGGCVDQVFTLKKIGEKEREITFGFYRFGQGVRYG